MAGVGATRQDRERRGDDQGHQQAGAAGARAPVTWSPAILGRGGPPRGRGAPGLGTVRPWGPWSRTSSPACRRGTFYLVDFVLPFVECSLFVGFVFPGETALVLAGVLASRALPDSVD